MCYVSPYTHCQRHSHQVTLCLQRDVGQLTSRLCSLWYKKISDPGLIVRDERDFLLKYKGSHCLEEMNSPNIHGSLFPCFKLEWPAGSHGGVIDPLIPIQPTARPGSSWSAEQVHEALRPAQTSRKFSIRDQSVLLTWQSLQPVQFHQRGVHWLHKYTYMYVRVRAPLNCLILQTRALQSRWVARPQLISIILLWQLNPFEPLHPSLSLCLWIQTHCTHQANSLLSPCSSYICITTY